VTIGGWADEPTVKLFEARLDGTESHEDARHTDLSVLEGELTVNGERAETGAWGARGARCAAHARGGGAPAARAYAGVRLSSVATHS
jgi:hypothetical protein